ncbi:peptidoglycan editing factor PgeF [Viscerimonas tarda]
MKHHPQYPNLLQFDLFGEYKSLFHFSTTCEGGFSKGSYASFNLGEYSGDDVVSVYKNRSQLASVLNIDPNSLLLPHQVHGDGILTVDADFLSLPALSQKEQLNGVDALITNCQQVCIGVTTADCVPLLVFDPIGNVLAAIHAGWRGTVAKIATKAVAQMQEKYGCNPQNLKAGIAPAISQACFEVGEEVVDAFSGAGFPVNDIGYRCPETGKIHLDLCCANSLLLTASGIPPQNIEIAGLCTYSHPDKFFSARRQTVKSGRMLTGGFLT